MSKDVTKKSSVLDPIRKEMDRQKAEKAKRKAERGPFSLALFLKNWAVRLMHTLFLIMIAYITIVGGTIFVDIAMGFIIGSLGYTVGNNAEFLLSILAGIFFTAWVFLISFLFLRFVWKQYIKNIKNTLPTVAAKNLDNLV